MKVLTSFMENKEKRYDNMLKVMSEHIHTFDIWVKSLKPPLSTTLIPFIADKADFFEDSQLSHAWRADICKAEKPKVKLKYHLRYNLYGFNFMCPWSNFVFAQSSAVSLDKLRKTWVRYKIPC